MVDLPRDLKEGVHARLLDLVPGRSGRVYLDWLRARGPVLTTGITVATVDPFHGYKNAIDDGLDNAVAVLDAFLPRERGDPRSSRSPPPPAMTCGAGSSRRRWATAGAAGTRCAGSAPPGAPGARTSHPASTSGCAQPSPPIPPPKRCAWRGGAPSTSGAGGTATSGASNGGTEAVNGLIELHRRVARGFCERGNYRLRMLLVAGGLQHPNLA